MRPPMGYTMKYAIGRSMDSHQMSHGRFSPRGVPHGINVARGVLVPHGAIHAISLGASWDTSTP